MSFLELLMYWQSGNYIILLYINFLKYIFEISVVVVKCMLNSYMYMYVGQWNDVINLFIVLFVWVKGWQVIVWEVFE